MNRDFYGLSRSEDFEPESFIDLPEPDKNVFSSEYVTWKLRAQYGLPIVPWYATLAISLDDDYEHPDKTSCREPARARPEACKLRRRMPCAFKTE